MSNVKNQLEKVLEDFPWMSADFTLNPEVRPVERKFQPSTLRLYRVEEVTYEEDSPQEEALENVFASLAIPGINVIYILTGNEKEIGIYFGVVEDRTEKLPDRMTIADIGDKILFKSLKGNFRGSVITKVEDCEEVMSRVFPKRSQTRPSKDPATSDDVTYYYKMLDGVPGRTKEREAKDFRGVDRLIDIMLGETFAVMLLAKPIPGNGHEVSVVEEKIDQIYQRLTWLAKTQHQHSESSGENECTSLSDGTSNGLNESKSPSVNRCKTTNSGDNGSQGSSEGGQRSSTNENTGWTKGWTQQEGVSESQSVSLSIGTSHQVSEQKGHHNDQSVTQGNEIVCKRVASWVKYLDDLVYPRIDCAKGRGLYIVSTLLAADKRPVLAKLANVMKSLHAGTEGNMVPFAARDIEVGTPRYNCVRALHQPLWQQTPDKALEDYAYAHSKCRSDGGADGNGSGFYDGTWMSASELSRLAGLPQKEVVGVRLRKEVEFGLNVTQEDAGESVLLGSLVQAGEEKDSWPVTFDASKFSNHIFVTGVTGSGKTTTCQQLLCRSCRPGGKRHFLVVEPAKTEYRSLVRGEGENPSEFKRDDILVFTLGNDIKGAPFYLNPLEFSAGESISSRVDMLMASMTAAFNMEAAIPQILESAIYKAYADYGWDVNTNENRTYPGSLAFSSNVYAFPTLSNVVTNAEALVRELGFDERLRDEYLGSIRARLGGLLIGAKGRMLNCPRSIDFMDLLDRNVVLELEEIRNGQQKALVIGFILTNLLVAIRRKYTQNGNHEIQHITLVEEAHRLLSRFEPGDDPNKRLAVETFADMLAEVRKYGEGMIIADQVPNKLTPDVLKNTNIKIVHRIFAQDDKDAVGATMALDDDQKSFLSSLKKGHVIAFSGDWPKAVHVRVPFGVDTSKQRVVPDAELRQNAIEYFAERKSFGVMPGLQLVDFRECSEDNRCKIFDAFCQKVFHADYACVVPEFRIPSIGRQKAKNVLCEAVSALKKSGLKESLAWRVVAVCFSVRILRRTTITFTADGQKIVEMQLRKFVEGKEALFPKVFNQMLPELS